MIFSTLICCTFIFLHFFSILFVLHNITPIPTFYWTSSSTSYSCPALQFLTIVLRCMFHCFPSNIFFCSFLPISLSLLPKTFWTLSSRHFLITFLPSFFLSFYSYHFLNHFLPIIFWTFNSQHFEHFLVIILERFFLFTFWTPSCHHFWALSCHNFWTFSCHNFLNTFLLSFF